MKKRVVFLGVFLSLLFSVGFAEGTGVDLQPKLVSIVMTLSGIITGISVMMIVYAGFKYATSMGDPYETDKAKNMIVSSGIGLMMGMSAMVIVRIMSASLEVEEVAKPSQTDSSPIIFFVVGAIALLIIGTIIAAFVTSKGEEEKEEEKETLEKGVDVSVFQDALDGAMNWKPQFEEESDATFINNGSKVLFQYEQTETVLRFFEEDSVYLISTYKLDSQKVDVQLVREASFEPTSSHYLQLQRIHEQILHLYIQQTGTFETWSSHLVSKLPSMNLQSRFSDLLTQYQNILPLAYQLDEEDRFFLEETFLRDCDLLLDSYLRLKPMQQTEHESMMVEKFDVLAKQIKALEEKLDSQYERDMVYAFKVIDKKYGEQKDEQKN